MLKKSTSLIGSNRAFVFSGAAVVLFAFWLRIAGILDRSLWFDEAFEFRASNVPFQQLSQEVVTSGQPPLFGYLLHGWLQVGIEPLWLRFLPVVFSLIALAGIMRWGRVLGGGDGSLIAGLIMALLPPAVYYAQDLGEYALMVATLTWSLYFLYLAQRRLKWRYWVLWSMLAALSVLSQYGAGIVLFSTAVAVLVENVVRKRSVAILRQGVVALASVVVGVPVLWLFFSQQIHIVQEKQAAALRLEPLIDELARSGRSLFETVAYHLIGWPESQVPGWLGIALLLIYAALAIRFYSRMPKHIIWWFVACYALYFPLVRTGTYVGFFGSRYSQIFLPLVVLIMAGVIKALMRRVNVAAGALLLGLSLASAIWSYPHPLGQQMGLSRSSWSPVEEMGEVHAYWWDNRQPGEATFVYYGAVPAFRYYLLLNGERAEPGSAARDMLDDCVGKLDGGACPEHGLFLSRWIRELSTVEKVGHMESRLGGRPDKLWLIYSHVYGDEDEAMLRELQPYYEISKQARGENAAAYLLETR